MTQLIILVSIIILILVIRGAFMIHQKYQIEESKWETIRRDHGSATYGYTWTTRGNFKMKSLIIVQRHRESGNIRGFLKNPNGSKKTLDKDYILSMYKSYGVDLSTCEVI